MLQTEALAILKTGRNVFLTGQPGAGKSHTVNRYVAYLRSCGVEPAITASTGIAATHINGLTIHSWAGIGIKKTLSRGELQDMLSNSRVVKRLNDTQVLIIDEISMLSGATLNLVDQVCQALRKSMQPFGGLQVVFVGDFFQLPPVSRQDEPMPQFAFMSDAWQHAAPTVCYLSEQHRQEDETFLSILSALRNGSLDEDHLAHLTARQIPRTETTDITTLFPHNADVDRINATHLAKLLGKEHSYAMAGHGAPPLIEQLKRGCLSPDKLTLKVGARVMFTKNHFDEGFVNGTTGVVKDFASENKYPIVELRSGRRIQVTPDTWSIDGDGRPLASVIQLPLRLAWAMTVHKSQGMSLDAAFVDLSQAFAYGQGYVALSRVRTLAGLYLGGLNARALEVDENVLQEDAKFLESSNGAQAELLEVNADELLVQHEAFIANCGGTTSAFKLFGDKAPRIKKAKKVKEPKWQKTLDLICNQKTIDEICTTLDRKPSTIMDHIDDLLALKKIVASDLNHLLFIPGINEIHTAFEAGLNSEFLKPIYEHFNGFYAYDLIRLARLLYSVKK
ncbi:TPA: AAA family ATPase [Candidatus Uhrbacteria bacterium]|nr:AAA family ATPase [Candidatus Uhrbacteria bacterium]